MKAYLRRLLILVILFFLFLGVREFIATYLMFRDMHYLLGYAFSAAVLLIIIWFGLVPALKILRLPKLAGPYAGQRAPLEHLQAVARILLKNKNVHQLCTAGDIQNLTSVDEPVLRTAIENIHKELSKALHVRRKLVVNQVFVGTALSQNGILDALIVLGRNVSMVYQTYNFYNGRPDTLGLFRIFKSCLKAVIISSGADSASDSLSEIAMQSFGIVREGGRGLPFVGTIIGSFSNGFINAVLTTRLALIAEAYCTKLEIRSERDLVPPVRTVIEIARHITNDMKGLLIKSYAGLDRGAKRVVEMGKNGIKDVLEKAFDQSTQYLKRILK